MALNVKLEAFEGPLDLLLHLIEKNQINIYDIPISELTDQYLGYLEGLEQLDIDLASEFLLMAATLLSIKSRMLLPKEKTEGTREEACTVSGKDDPRMELVEKLIEYKRYKMIAEVLKEKEETESKIFKHKREDLSFLFEGEISLSEVNLDDLILIFTRIIKKGGIEGGRTLKTILKDPLPLKVRIKQVYKILLKRKRMFFREFFQENSSKLEIIMTFLAILELIKLNRVKVKQERLFGEITVVLKEEG
ncbi:Segregation and condensation protein A [Fervidicola ferrireducens]|uniref:Segregation and condensation protein A n=1 Tax=Fervidicola ferrireducens TaxID=520764 RepID=A0A140L0Q9_9FIRM|nr:segregation/condensation protein A [Fervidicola ferrireducens]KXG74134.1 Segregation and condensation protein A [Fervidicola ferrireducens]